ncbi:unnamed protein product, partial [Ilex paraguariensis]
MSDAIPASTEWLQYYQLPPPSYEVLPDGLSNNTVVTTTPSTTKDFMLSPNTSITRGGDLSHRACIRKPIQMRSRASRRTPAN